MFPSFFQKITTIVHQNKFSSQRVLNLTSLISLFLGFILLKTNNHVTDDSAYGNPIFIFFSVILLLCSIFFFGACLLYSLTDGKLSFKEYFNYTISPKQNITLKYVKDNFDMIYKVFEKNNSVDNFRIFYNGLEKNTLSKKDYENIYNIMILPSFKFSFDENNHQSEQSFEKMATLFKNKSNQKSSDIKFFDND